MSNRPTTIERAFELADSGEFASATDIRSRLKAEGYPQVDLQIYGSTLTRQIKTICNQARARRAT